MTDRQRLDAVCRIAGIRRVRVSHEALRRTGVRAESAAYMLADGREFWFGPDGEPLGYWNEVEGLAAIRRCVLAIEACA